MASSKVLYFDNLPSEWTEAKLRHFLNPIGTIHKIVLLRKRNAVFLGYDPITLEITKSSTIQALVEVADLEIAARMIKAMENTPLVIDGITVTVTFSKNQELRDRGISGRSSRHTSGDHGKTNRILLVTVQNPTYPITTDLIHEVFEPYGTVEKIVIFVKPIGLQCLVQLASTDEAVQAKNALAGLSIFPDCCALVINFSNLPQELIVKENGVRTKDFLNPDLPVAENDAPVNPIADISNAGILGYPVTTGGKGHDQAASGGREVVSPVLLVSNLRESVTCDCLFNLFSCYGNVARIKKLNGKPDHALIQFSSPLSSQSALVHLRGFTLLGRSLEISFSKHSYISIRPGSATTDGASAWMKEYGHSLNRFTGKYTNATKHIYSPTKILHLSNFDESTTQEELKTHLGTFQGAEHAKVKIFASPSGHLQALAEERKKTPRQASIAAFFSPQAKPKRPRQTNADEKNCATASPVVTAASNNTIASIDKAEEKVAELRRSPRCKGSPQEPSGKEIFTTPPPTKRARVTTKDKGEVIDQANKQVTQKKSKRGNAKDTSVNTPTKPPHTSSTEAATAAELIDLTDVTPDKDLNQSTPKSTKQFSSSSSTSAQKSRGKVGTKNSVTTTTATPSANTANTTKEQEKKASKASKTAATEESTKESDVTPAVVVLDPVLKARIDTYQLKIEELTDQITQLFAARHGDWSSDGDASLLQELYGVGLDIELNKGQMDVDKTFAELCKRFTGEQRIDTAKDEPTQFVEISEDVRRFIAQNVQGKTASLSALSGELIEMIQQKVSNNTENIHDSDQMSEGTLMERLGVMMEMEIKMLAQRTTYGIRPSKANIYEDTSVDALWIWEVGSVDKYFDEEAQKIIKRMRKNRKRLGQQLKTLGRVVQLLQQSPVDEVKISAEEAKVGKFVLLIESETRKAQERERKEQEKANAAEEKKRQELERQQAKEEEKRKRELELEAEKIQSSKRRKSLVSYFRSIDSSNVGGDSSVMGSGLTSGSGFSLNGLSASLRSGTDTSEVEIVSAQNETMVRMDTQIGFLKFGAGRDASSSVINATSDPNEAMVLMKDKKTASRISARSGRWGIRQRRDPKLGVMKFFQFHENHRPAYYGTFSTRSRLFRDGRRPFARYAKFDYSVDSDDEWEEEEPGESLSGIDSDGDESEDDNLDYGDKWLAYEDEVDYIDGSDNEEKEEDEDDHDATSPERRRKLPAQLEQKKGVRVPASNKHSKLTKLEPQIVGPFWCSSNECSEHFTGYSGHLLRVPCFESPLLLKARAYEKEQERLQQIELQKQQEQETSQQNAAVKSTKVNDKSTPHNQHTQGPDISTTSPAPKPSNSGASTSATSVQQSSKPGITAWFKPRENPERVKPTVRGDVNGEVKSN